MEDNREALAASQGRRDGQAGREPTPPDDAELRALYLAQYQEGRATRADLSAIDRAYAITGNDEDAAALARLLQED